MALSKQEMQQLTQGLIVFELERAREKFPKPTSSPHEGFAVLKEEIDELDEELDLLKVMNDVLWSSVRNDDLEKQKDILSEMKIVVVRLLKEAVQVGAMIDKYNQDFL